MKRVARNVSDSQHSQRAIGLNPNAQVHRLFGQGLPKRDELVSLQELGHFKLAELPTAGNKDLDSLFALRLVPRVFCLARFGLLCWYHSRFSFSKLGREKRERQRGDLYKYMCSLLLRTFAGIRPQKVYCFRAIELVKSELQDSQVVDSHRVSHILEARQVDVGGA